MKKYIPITIALCLLLALIVINSTQAKTGAINGIGLCSQIIIPALLPVLIICSTIVNSKCNEIINIVFKPLARLLHLPKVTASVLALGLVGGYPAGAILTNELYNQGAISASTAKRLLRYNFCGGVAFIITAVGNIKLKSISLGASIYLINIMVSLLIGYIDGLKHKKESYYYERNDKLGLNEATTKAVEGSTKSILVMSSYIIFFSALFSVIKLPQIIMPFIEITSGVFGKYSDFSFLAAALSFGGFCIHFQLMDIINNIKMKYIEFLGYRIASAVLSYFLGKIYTYFFPQQQEVFSNIASATPKVFQVNIGLSVVLLIGCVALVVDIQNKKSKLL